MSKKELIKTSILLILTFGMLAFTIYLLANKDKIIDSSLNPNSDQNIELPANGISINDIPTVGNNLVLTTNNQTKMRIINEYSPIFFKGKKNLLIMFGSWCPNCQAEILEISKILDYYKDNEDVEIVLIAHEFADSHYPLTDITEMLETKVNFGDVEVLIDFNRIIRSTLDPEANTVPVSYVVDEKGKVINKFSESLTLEKAIDLINTAK